VHAPAAVVPSARGGRQYADAIEKQIRTGVIDSAPLRASQWMRPHKDGRRTGMPFDGLDNLSLRAADISHENVTGRGFGYAPHVVGNPADWRAHNDHIRVKHAGLELRRGATDRTLFYRRFECVQVPSDADHFRREFTGPKGQSD